VTGNQQEAFDNCTRLGDYAVKPRLNFHEACPDAMKAMN